MYTIIVVRNVVKDLFASLHKALQYGLKALTHADNGELLPLSSKIGILHGEEPRAISQPSGRASAVVPRMRIVVAFDGQVEHGTLRYAADAALHYDATLDILINVGVARLDFDTERELREITPDWQVVSVAGDMLRAITRYTLRHSKVLFVVTSIRDALTGKIVAARQAGCTVNSLLLVYSQDRLRAA
jgi:hypothetical protein